MVLIIAISSQFICCNSNKLSTSNDETQEDTNNSSEKNDKNDDNNTAKSETSDKNEKAKDTTSSNNKDSKDNKVSGKEKYIAKLDAIEKGLSDLDKLYAGTTLEMKSAAGQEYKRWDDALNEIYKNLKDNLDKDTIAKLEQEELNWIKEKESKAKSDSLQYKGGTLEGLEYTTSLSNSTKERCYYLVNNYMK